MAEGREAIFLMGPTGAGKSYLALLLADEFDLEIVSVDSALVYRGMDIGTAKPSAAARARTPHHLIDIRDPAASYSAGDFTRDATAAMQEIWARGRRPLLTGGTMLYFHALTHGIACLPEANVALRAALDARAALAGWASLHRELERIDPAAARRIHANDPQRIQRALEVFELTGETITSMQQRRVSALADVKVIELAIAPLERGDLHTRLGARFHAMIEQGLVGEVGHLFSRGDLTAEHPAMRAVGYRQLWRHLSGISALNQSIEEAIAATRQLAKRQLTWLRKREKALWFDSMHRDVAPLLCAALSRTGGMARREG